MKRAFAALLGAALMSACGQSGPSTEAASAAPEVKLYAMDCGRISLTDADVFADDGAYEDVAQELVDPCYLIRHPDGDMIWDAGLPTFVGESEGGVDNGPFHLELDTTLPSELAELGLTPDDIDIVSFSHSHFDHVGQVAQFANARWIVDADERAWMFNDENRAAETFGLVAPLETWTPTLIEGDGDYDVFGDGSVVIVQAPGHTPGHTILKLELANAGTVLLTGDMWHIAESQEARRVPRFNVDREQTLASMDKVEALAAETDATIIRQHVPADRALIPAFPEALD